MNVSDHGAMSEDELLDRYRRNYGLSEENAVTIDQVRWHLELERSLTARLRASSPEMRWETFQACYDELYSELPWLVDTGGMVETGRWMRLLGPPPQRIHEVGSGNGELAAALAAYGYEVEATDISSERGGPRREVDGLQWTVTDGVHLDRFARRAPYDAVLSDQVVEHLHPDDLEVHLRSCRSILRNGGKYLVRTPHAFTGPHDVSRIFGFSEPVGMHLREYTNRQLTVGLKTAGFTRVRAVFHVPGKLGLPADLDRASAAYLAYLRSVERLTGHVVPDLRRRLLLRLPGPLRPRVFLLATR
jgi:SAM-dependent methyltransferase